MNLTTYAVVGDGDELYLTVINKEHDLHAKGAEVSVVVPREYDSVELMRMEQAAGNVATSDVRLGGAAMQVNGPGTACGDKIGGSTVLIPAGTAAILRFTTQTPRP